MSGLSLLFPFELPMFAATFEKLNALGLPQLVGLGELNTDLAPHTEMQYAQLWHAIVSFVLMAVMIAIGASYALPELGFSSQAQSAGNAVRLD